MNCTPSSLATASIGYYGIPSGMMPGIIAYLVGVWASGVTPTSVIIQDSGGTRWLLVIAIDGNIGAQTTTDAATPDVILADGSGGFWKIIVATDGVVGTEANAGPATAAPTAGNWQLIVDTLGNLGVVSI